MLMEVHTINVDSDIAIAGEGNVRCCTQPDSPVPARRAAPMRRAHLTARPRTNGLPVLTADSFRPLSRGWHYTAQMDANSNKETAVLPYTKTTWKVGDEDTAPSHMLTSTLAYQIGHIHDCTEISNNLKLAFVDLGAVRCPQRVTPCSPCRNMSRRTLSICSGRHTLSICLSGVCGRLGGQGPLLPHRLALVTVNRNSQLATRTL